MPQPGASVAQLRAATDRVAAARRADPRDRLLAADRRRALDQAQRGRALVIPLRARVDEDAAISVAEDLRHRLAVGEGPTDGVSTHLVGQAALWAGDAGPLQAGPGEGRVGGLPDRPA